MTSPRRIRLGTRGSALARWQADWAASRLAELGVDVVLVEITTAGDRHTEGPIGGLGAQGVFTKEIQRALLEDRIDLAVHSLKDVPTEAVPGLCLAAVPERAPVADVLVCRKHRSLDELPEGAAVGTGSLRRRAQLLHVRPDLVPKDVRGNIDTRLRKLDRGDFEALVLAEAGLSRLGLREHIAQVLPLNVVLPAVGQGALGLETRADDRFARPLVEKLDHPASHAAVLAERAMLAALFGGCLAPIAAWGRIENGKLTLTGRVLTPDGGRMVESTLTGEPSAAVALGQRVAAALADQGAGPMIEAARGR
jgi:hydroxymethylbilane synthase